MKGRNIPAMGEVHRVGQSDCLPALKGRNIVTLFTISALAEGLRDSNLYPAKTIKKYYSSSYNHITPFGVLSTLDC